MAESKNKLMNKILLHACCATCSGYPLEKLKEMGYQPILYFFNPNIYPKEEFEKRLSELQNYAQKKEIELIVDKYLPQKWYNYIAGLENEPEKGARCQKCFEYRLIHTAKKAKELGLNCFTTTLTVSPHKQSKVIFETAKKIAVKFELDFIEVDFKKQNGFLKTMQIAKNENFYRQNYCGCEYSIRKV